MRITDTKFNGLLLLLPCRGTSRRVGWELDFVSQAPSGDLVYVKGSQSIHRVQELLLCPGVAVPIPLHEMPRGLHQPWGSQLEYHIHHLQPVEDVNKDVPK